MGIAPSFIISAMDFGCNTKASHLDIFLSICLELLLCFSGKKNKMPPAKAEGILFSGVKGRIMRLFLVWQILEVGAPQAVQVAVGKNGYGLVAAQGEGQLGLFAGVEHLALAALVGQNVDPFDPVFFAHGVFHRTNGGGQGVALYLILLWTVLGYQKALR